MILNILLTFFVLAIAFISLAAIYFGGWFLNRSLDNRAERAERTLDYDRSDIWDDSPEAPNPRAPEVVDFD